MLSKMGWSEGESLGKSGDGMTEPVSKIIIIFLRKTVHCSPRGREKTLPPGRVPYFFQLVHDQIF